MHSKHTWIKLMLTLAMLVFTLCMALSLAACDDEEPKDSGEYIEKQYVLQFNSCGGSEVQSLTGIEGSTHTLSAEPTKEGYYFVGWAERQNSDVVYRTGESYTFRSNKTVFAVWAELFDVVYDANGGSFESAETKLTVAGQRPGLLSVPEEPVKENYIFTGWYTDAEMTTPWNLIVQQATGEMTLYAGWKTDFEEYSVTYQLHYPNNAYASETKSTEWGLINYVPVCEGYLFNGWWVAKGESDIYGYLWNPATLVSESGLVLHASWIKESEAIVQLDPPTITVTDTLISWKPLDGAVSYLVYIYSGSEQLYSLETTNTSCSFPSGYASGVYSVRVQALGDGYRTLTSPVSTTSHAYHVLSSPTIYYDVNEDRLCWTTVPNASYYALYINGEYIADLTYTAYDMSAYEAGSYTVRVDAEASGYIASTTSAMIMKYRLKTPEVESMVIQNEYSGYWENYLTWDAVDHADKYLILVNGEQKDTVYGNTYYTISNDSYLWGTASTMEVVVVAFNDVREYIASRTVTPVTLKKLYRVSLENDTSGAADLYVENSGFAPATSQITFLYNYEDAGVYTTQTVLTGTGAHYPATLPTRSGYAFRGWFTDSYGSHVFDFTTTVTEDITLYAGWESISTNYSYSVIDIREYYNSSSNYGEISTSTERYIYFSALTSGNYTLYYRNYYSGDRTYLSVYNVTTGTTIRSNSYITNTSYYSVTLSLNAGDVVRIRTYAYSSSYTGYFNYYITGGATPESWPEADIDFVAMVRTESANPLKNTAPAEVGTTISVVAEQQDSSYTFLGWYNRYTGDCVSTDLRYTFTVGEGNVSLVAMWG